MLLNNVLDTVCMNHSQDGYMTGLMLEHIHTFLYLDNLVVVYVVQRIGSIPSSNHRRIGQEVGAIDPILKIKLGKIFMLKKRSFYWRYNQIHMIKYVVRNGYQAVVLIYSHVQKF